MAIKGTDTSFRPAGGYRIRNWSRKEYSNADHHVGNRRLE